MNPELDRLRQELLMAQPPSAPRLDQQMLQGYLKTSGFANALSQGLGGPKLDNQLGDVLQAIGISRDQLLDDWKNQIQTKKVQLDAQIDIERLAQEAAESNLRQGLLGSQGRSVEEDVKKKKRENKIGAVFDPLLAVTKFSGEVFESRRKGAEAEKSESLAKVQQTTEKAQIDEQLAKTRKLVSEMTVQEMTEKFQIKKSEAESLKAINDARAAETAAREAVIKSDFLSNVIDDLPNMTSDQQAAVKNMILGAKVYPDSWNEFLALNPKFKAAVETNAFKDNPDLINSAMTSYEIHKDPELTDTIRQIVPVIIDMRDRLYSQIEYSNNIIDGPSPQERGLPNLKPKGQKLFLDEIIDFFAEPRFYQLLTDPQLGNDVALRHLFDKMILEFPDIKDLNSEKLFNMIIEKTYEKNQKERQRKLSRPIKIDRSSLSKPNKEM